MTECKRVMCSTCSWRGYRKLRVTTKRCPRCNERVVENMISGVYLLAIVDARTGEHVRFKHAAHYRGYTTNFAFRLMHHRSGNGSNLVRHVMNAGFDVRVVRTWPHADRNFERKLKKRGSACRVCPECREGKLIERENA